jgi:hypothetical protein
MTIDKATTRHNIFISAYNENRHENFHPLNEAFLQGMWKCMVQDHINDSVMNFRISFTYFIISLLFN